MSIPSTHTVRESGHAVTLTLLGLAIAILAGVVVLYVVGKERPEPIPVSEMTFQEEIVDEEEMVDPRADWNTYENTVHRFSFEYPDGWIVATGTILGVPVVTTYDAMQALEASSTFGVHEADTRVSVYPRGIPLEGFGEKEVSSSVIVQVPEASAKDLTLGTSKRPWATIVRFDRFPTMWTASGFVFARTHITEEEVAFMRGDEEVSAEEYDVYAGDHIVRSGFVDPAMRTLQEEILQSFRFLPDADPRNEESAVTDDMQVSQPEENVVITSPLTIAGEARGTWFFEGSFPVKLVDADGAVLAEVPATAQDEWMTEDFVSFEVSLAFASTTATSGTLVLSRANPSGMPELDASVTVPVLFSL